MAIKRPQRPFAAPASRCEAKVTRALILTGAPGSGKSSVLDALSTLLEVGGIPFGAIEAEHFARGCPWLTASQWIPQLAAVVQLQREAGRQLFLVVATTETETELRAVIEALAAHEVVVVCLSAPPDLVARRVAEREPDAWPGKLPLIEHARELADAIPSLAGIDAVLTTVDRQPMNVACELKALMSSKEIIRDSS